MNEDFPDPSRVFFPDKCRDWGCLDELGAGPDDRDDLDGKPVCYARFPFSLSKILPAFN